MRTSTIRRSPHRPRPDAIAFAADSSSAVRTANPPADSTATRWRASSFAMARAPMAWRSALDQTRRVAAIERAGTRVSNLAVSRGGSAPPPYADARVRFAELLRTRDRVVTIDDVEITARAFEPRIKRVDVKTASELGPHGVRQVDVVDVRVAPSDFADPESELPTARRRYFSRICSSGRSWGAACEWRCCRMPKRAKANADAVKSARRRRRPASTLEERSRPSRARSRSGDENAPLGMPDLVRARRLARQSLDSALTTLYALGVDDSRVVVESVGRGWEAGTIVEQSPAPGSPLTSRTRVVLKVAGPSAIDSLPFAMRDEDEYEFRSDRLFALFDSPLAKLATSRASRWRLLRRVARRHGAHAALDRGNIPALGGALERRAMVRDRASAAGAAPDRRPRARTTCRLSARLRLPVESVAMHAGMVKLRDGGTTRPGRRATRDWVSMRLPELDCATSRRSRCGTGPIDLVEVSRALGRARTSRA